MFSRILPQAFTDWSQLDKNDPFWKGIDISTLDNFGIHMYNGKLWTSGFVGVGRLYDRSHRPLVTNGKEHIVVITSQYGMDPWKMLEKVMTDDEYDDYIQEIENNGKFLFKVFYDQPLIKLTQDYLNDADILYALSYINACYSLCKKGIKKKMFYQEENYDAKVRGKIDIQKNIRKNTCNGRNDRFYCKYIDFTEDNIENRILKATLIKCKKTVEQKFGLNSKMLGRVHYCLNSFKKVKLVAIKIKDFNYVSVSGLYTYYKPLLQQAKSILSQKYHAYKAEDGKVINKCIYTIPYMINMETVFEFYVRVVLKEILDKNKYILDAYSKPIFIESGVENYKETMRGIHLMPYCIPDIIIKEKDTDSIVAVLDAKYKPHDRATRVDSHQLLAYVLLTGTDRCGFIFPGQTTELKQIRGTDYLEIDTPLVQQLKYYELVLGNVIVSTEIEKIFQ